MKPIIRMMFTGALCLLFVTFGPEVSSVLAVPSTGRTLNGVDKKSPVSQRRKTAQATGKPKPRAKRSGEGSKARPGPARRRGVGQKAVFRRLKTVIFGRGSDIEGGVDRPDGEAMTGRSDVAHSNLIRLRQHFLPEIYRSAERL
ncbi:MAG: hypothetical protein MJE77_34290 [Proteobacteria bacterium]|nr:hypothetical protein [Pseudomonadota bacterium]